MPFEIGDLHDIVDAFNEKLFLANRTGEIENFLRNHNLYSLYKSEDDTRLQYDSRAKILIIGSSSICEDDIYKVAKKCKINTNLLECELDYKKLTNYNFTRLEYNTGYRCILIGPLPHSVKGKGNYASIISKMESEIEKYPQILKLQNSNELKITKSILEKTFREIS